MSNHQEKNPGKHGWFMSSLAAGWQLAKVPLCLLIGCSAGFGAMLAPHASGERVLLLMFSVLLLAMGCATLNSLQERVADQSMRRTSDRPLVRNRVSSRFALLQTVSFLGAGFFLLAAYGGPPEVPAMGGFAIVLYNGIYTKLKQKTVLAIIPGAVCGGLPPLIGWVGAGGEPASFMPLLLFVLLFMWQMPHFCLILLHHREDYIRAQQPNFLRMLDEAGVRRLSVVWICGLALVMMLFSTTSAPVWQWQSVLLMVNAMVLAGLTTYSLLLRETVGYRGVFISLNIMLFNHMMILSLGFLRS